MPLGKILNDFGKGKIAVLAQQGLSARQIGLKLNRSDHVIRNYLKNPAEYGKKPRSGRPRKLSKRDERLH